MWKDVVGYEGYYEVSDDGVVRSVRRVVRRSDGVEFVRQPRVMTQHNDKDGYVLVKLSKNGKSKQIPVHRLVAMAYVSGYSNGMEVNHIDCDRTNNNFWNLEWVTHAGNVAYTKSLKRHVSDSNISGANNPNYGNHTLRDRFANEPSLAIVQSRPGACNGRARPIRLMFEDGDIIDFGYIREAAKYIIDNGRIDCLLNVDNASTGLRMAAESGKTYHGITPILI